MSKKLLVESDPHQTRIAVLEEDRLAEIFIERVRHRGHVGNVYRGRVSRILPGIQAAFVNVGLERDAFLFAGDVRDELAELADLEGDDLDLGGDEPDEERSINELLGVGQELIVQVLKDPLPNKGARVTTQIALPGRYLVLLPTVRDIGISRRIEDEEERERLTAVLDRLGPVPGGVIVRTAGEGREIEAFESDLAYLSRRWGKIGDLAERSVSPSLLHRELDVSLRAVRDLFSAAFESLLVEGGEAYERIVEVLGDIEPGLVDRVELYEDSTPLFECYGIEKEIEAALKSRVWLDSGGYIVINQTEALVAIDVNTGRYVGGNNLEETVVETNLEAVREIVRHIRLRDLSGIIVVDFIDMVDAEHRQQVFATLEQELEKDRSKNQLLSISDFGLVEITRKRSRTNLERLLTQPCPYCQGRGRIRSATTVCLNLRRYLLRNRERYQTREVVLRVHPEIAKVLERSQKEVLGELELALATTLTIEGDPGLHREQFEVVDRSAD